MTKPLTDYERFVLEKVLASLGKSGGNPDTTDEKELEAARRIVAAFQNAERTDGRGKRMPTLRQEWQQSLH